MSSWAVDVVTALSIVSIAAILTVYILILKRNGWIGKTSNYRCPNPDCKKIFHSALKVKDYSDKKDTRIACPECGYDLGSSNNKNALMQSKVKNTAVQKNQLSTDKIETEASKTNIQNEKVEAINTDLPILETILETSPPKVNEYSEKVTFGGKIELENASSIHSEVQSPAFTEQREKLEEIETANSRKENIRAKKGKNKKAFVANKDRPLSCNNYFGYLWTLPKGVTTPDECFACSKLIDCYKEVAS